MIAQRQNIPKLTQFQSESTHSTLAGRSGGGWGRGSGMVPGNSSGGVAPTGSACIPGEARDLFTTGSDANSAQGDSSISRCYKCSRNVYKALLVALCT